MNVNKIVVGALVSTALASGVLLAQRTVGFEWPVGQMDAQRTSWMRADPNISVESLQQPGFELQWSLKLDPEPRQLESLNAGVTQSGITLFTPLSVIAGSPNVVYAVDNDTGNLFWEQRVGTAPAMGTVECPGALTTAVTRSTNLLPDIPAARGGGRGGRGGYQGAVGEPGEGVPMELAVRGGGRGRAAAAGPAAPAGAAGAPAAPAPAPAAPAAPPAQAARGAAPAAPGAQAPAARAGGGGFGGGGGRGGGPQGFYLVSSDGMLRVLGPSSGKEIREPARLLPAGARVADLIAVDGTVYATTINRCGGSADGIYTVAAGAEETPAAARSWRTNGGSPAGPIAFSTDGTLFVAVGPGQASANGYANAVVALDADTLTVKDWFTQPDAAFATGPVVIQHNGRELVAAATTDGRVFLLDPSSLGGSSHATPLAVSAALNSGSTDYVPLGLAAWHEVPDAPADAPPAALGVPADAPADPPGQAWILLPIGPPASGAALPGGTVTNGAVVSLRVADTNGRLSLTPAWTSADLTSPSAPIVVNGVVFAVSRGLYHPASGTAVAPSDRAARSSRAVLHAFDGLTGRELWNSGTTLPTFVSARGPWAANSQIYVPTFDGTISAFGFAVGRH